MKKLCVLFLILFILSACAAEPVDPNQLIGKNYDDLDEYLVTNDYLIGYGYAFAKDHAGNPVVLELELNDDDQNIVTNAAVFDKRNVDNSPAVFASLEEGMTIYEVVELIGIPTGYPGSGFFYLEFVDSEGTVYWIRWVDWDGPPIRMNWIVNPDLPANP